MATIQSEVGKLFIMEDFFGAEDIIANTAASRPLPSGFRIIGQGIAEADSGITVLETDPNLNGVGVFTTTNETEHSCGICTAKMLDVGLMAPMVMECRVQFPDLGTKQFYFGLTDHNDDTAILEGETVLGSGTALTLTASDLCGFLYSTDLTNNDEWHYVYHGGTATGEIVSTNAETGVTLVAGEYNILRIEVDNNGTARWFIDGVLKKTLAGAVSTSVDLALIALLETKDDSIEYAKVDYCFLSANRDWTV